MGLGGRMMFVFSPDIGLGFTEASRLILFSRARTLGSSAPVRRSAGDEKTLLTLSFGREQNKNLSFLVLSWGWSVGWGLESGSGRAGMFFFDESPCNCV